MVNKRLYSQILSKAQAVVHVPQRQQGRQQGKCTIEKKKCIDSQQIC